MNIKLWDRAEPLKSAAIWAFGVFALVEVTLLLGGKWVLIDQVETEGSDAQIGHHVFVPATRTWRVLDCTYWTGRSTQTIEATGEYNPVPLECPFITDAQ